MKSSLHKMCFFILLSISNYIHTDALVIGIAGGTGSGKTTLAKKLATLVGQDAVVINQDSYYKELNHLTKAERDIVNFDHPDALDFDLLEQHILSLKGGKSIHVPCYDFSIHARTSASTLITPHPIIIVEGILLFAVPKIRSILDICIFVDAEDDVRFLRRAARDIEERGRDFPGVCKQYQTTVKPMHNRYVASSKSFAHLIVPGDSNNDVAVNILHEKIKSYLRNKNH